MEKMTNDDYPSIIEYYETLIRSKELFEEKILEMDDKQVTSFYKYVIKRPEIVKRVNESPLWYIKCYLEALEPVQNYLNGDMKTRELSLEEQESIAKTLRLLEERKHPSPLKRLIKYFKG